MADTPTSTTSTSATPDILRIRSESELRTIAENQINTEIVGQTSPLQADVNRSRDQENRSLAELGTMFGSLLPFVADSASRVESAYGQATQVQGDIFRAAADQLASLKQQRAQRAQAMAQEVGGPVAIDDFTDPLSPVEAVFPFQAAGSQLEGLANAQEGVQRAEAFAGKVFPALRTETEMRTRAKFEDRINSLQDEINSITSQRESMVSSRLADLFQAERETALQVQQQELAKLQADREYQIALSNLSLESARMAADSASASAELAASAKEATIRHQEFEEELAVRKTESAHDWDRQAAADELDRLKADRDWKIAQKQLAQEAQRIKLAKQQFGLDVSGTTGKYKGKPTQAAKNQSQQYQLALKQLHQANVQIKQRKNESDRDYHQRVVDAARNYKINHDQAVLNQKTWAAQNARAQAESRQSQLAAARQFVADLMGGGGSSSHTISHFVQVPPPSKVAQLSGKTDGAFRRKVNGKWVWGHMVTETAQVASNRPITSPAALYRAMIAGGISASIARNVVQSRFPKWKP